MNIANLDKLIAELEAAPDEKFEMSSYFTGVSKDAPCGTAACVAGWCLWLSGAHESAPSYCVSEKATNWLGLSYYQADLLFQPIGFYTRSPEFTRCRAVSTLKRLRETGGVDWGRAPKAAS